jgi:hypothetical protein
VGLFYIDLDLDAVYGSVVSGRIIFIFDADPALEMQKQGVGLLSLSLYIVQNSKICTILVRLL